MIHRLYVGVFVSALIYGMSVGLYVDTHNVCVCVFVDTHNVNVCLCSTLQSMTKTNHAILSIERAEINTHTLTHSLTVTHTNTHTHTHFF